jgi:para-aminobenzoate synthetase component 1
MSFECGHAWESFPWTEAPSCSLPDFCFARYRKGIAFSPDGELHLCLTQELGNEELSEKTELLDSFQSLLHSCEGLSSGGEEANCEMLEGLQSSSSPESFQEKVSLLRDWIGAGELFQANLSHLMGAPFRKSPRLLYSQVRQAQETAMSAYWENEKGHALLSWSPERFLKIDGEQLQTSPIKGTAPRGLTPVEDQELIAELESNEKERAELTMIVDMARNDLGRVAKSGKVHVVSAGKVEHFSTLHHRTALVNAEWNPSQGISALFRSAFPPASVTGAPKVRALQAIAELERESRGPYCGSFGIWQPGVNRGEFSVLIRTATCMSDRLQVRVGAGIVWDSQPEKEWNETLLKARYLECATPSIQSCR